MPGGEFRTREWESPSNREVRAQARVAAERQSADQLPRAEHAYYDSASGRVMIEFENGVVFGFPTALGQGLAGASVADLAEVELTPGGVGLHWESLDADLLISALLQGVFGSKHWMRELGRRGGQARTAAKIAASRRNGQKGGRPKGT